MVQMAKDIRMTINAKKTKTMQILRQRGKPPKNMTSFRLYEGVDEFKYLGTSINSRSVITPELQVMKKRTNLCIHTIHKLPQNIIDMATWLEIFGVNIQPHFTGCLAALAFAPKTIYYIYLYKYIYVFIKNTIK